MANFRLTTQLVINGPANMRAITQQIQRQLSSINANVNFRINPSATRNVNGLNAAAARLSSTLQNLTANANRAVPALNNLAAALAANAANINTAAQATQGLQKNLQNVQKTTQQTTNSMEALGKQAANAIKRYAAFSIAAGGIYELASAIKSGFKEALDFQNEMVKLSQVTGSSVKSLSGLSDEVTRLATTLGVSSKTLLNTSQTLAQAGFTAKEVKTGLEALAKTELAPTFKNIENTTEGAIAAMKQFGIEIGDLEGTLGSINSVSAQFAVESDDLVTAIRRSGSAFKAAGGNLEEFIALFTSVRQTTRESAETIATGFRTIFTRIQRPATLNYFKSLGVELTDAKGNFIGAYEAVRRLSSALQGIESTDPRFAKIVEELGGFRQVSKVIPLLQQFAVSEKALGVAIRGRASLSKDAETAQESLLRQLVKVKEEFAELFRTVISDSSFRSLVDITISATKSFIDLAKAATPLIPILTSIFAIKAGAGLGSFAKGFSGAFGTKKFARGGVVPGQGNGDTVPAMLTPGEFVVNKKSAQAIGYGNLQSMNKVQKFANGGVVKFAGGGKAQATSGGDGFAKFYALGTILPGIVTQFASLGEEARRFSGVLGGAIGIYAVLSPQLKQFSTNISEMSAKVQSTSKVLEAKKQADIKTLTDTKDAAAGVIRNTNKTRINKVRNDVNSGLISRSDGAYSLGVIRKQQQQQLSGLNSQLQTSLSDLDRDYADRANTRREKNQKRFGKLISRQKREQIGTAFGIGGAIAGLAGGAIRDSSAQDIRNNQGGFKFGSALSGAGNGAAIGAAIGSAIPIIGTAAGAVGGAVVGLAHSLYSSGEEAKKMIEQLDFNDTFDSLEKSLNDVASGKVTLSSQSSNIGSQLDKTRANFFSTNPELRKEAVNRTASQASNFESILGKFTATAKSIEDVKKASGGLGDKLITILSELNNVPASELEDTIKKQIDANTKQVDLQRKMSEAIANSDNAFLRLKQSTDGIVESFRSASESVDHLGAAFDSAFTRIGSSTTSSSNVKLESAGLRDFGNTRDTSRLTSALQPLLKPLGKQGADFGAEVTNISQGIKQLPNILQSLSGSAGFLDPVRFTETLGNELGKFGETFKNVVVGNAGSVINGDSGETELFNKLKTDPKALAEELTRQFEFLPKALEEANKMLEDNLNNYAKRSSQISELELNIREENVKNIQLGFEKSSRLTELRGGQVTSDDVIKNIDSQRNTRTKGETATTAGLSQLQKDIYENEQKILKGDKDLIPATENLKVRLASLTSVLKDTATNFDKVNAIISDIKKEQGLRSFKKNTIDDYIYGDNESRTRTIQSVAATNAVANGANLEDMHPEVRQGIKSFVDSLPDDFKFNALGGKTKKEFQDEQRTKSLKAAGVSDVEIKAINDATPKEDKLYTELDKAFKQMESAQKTFENFIGGQKDVLSAALADSNTIFENNLKTMLLSEQKNSQQDIQDKATAEQKASQNKKDAIKELLPAQPNETQIETSRRYVSGKDEYENIKKKEAQAFQLLRIQNSAGGNTDIRDILPSNLSNNASELDTKKQLMSKEAVSKALEQGISFENYSAAVSGIKPKYDNSNYETGPVITNSNPEEEFLSIIKKLVGNSGTRLEAENENRKKEFSDKYGADFNTYNLDTVEKQSKLLQRIGDTTAEAIDNTFERLEVSIKTAGDRIKSLQSELDSIPKKPEVVKPAQAKARGGIVYANRGMFVPKGTDTVPAMLTPGEFVVNAKAAKQNMGLLHQINTQYKANGGVIKGPDGLWKATGGAKLSTAQQRENLIHKVETERAARVQQQYLSRVFNNNNNIDTIPQNKENVPQRKPFDGEANVNGVPLAKAKELVDKDKKKSANINGELVGNRHQDDFFGRRIVQGTGILGKISEQQEKEKQEKAIIKERTLANIELIRKQNNPNYVSPEDKARAEKNKDILSRPNTNMINFNNRLEAAKNSNTKLVDYSKLDNSVDRATASIKSKDKALIEASSIAKYSSSTGKSDKGNTIKALMGNTTFEQAFPKNADEIERRGNATIDFRKGNPNLYNTIYRSSGGSTDTVPAMLSPGEFVLNRNAVNRVGSNNLQKFNKGGPVNYLAGGGAAGSASVPSMDTGALTAAINIFNTSATTLANALSKIPTSISLEANIQPVEVIINGAEVLSQLQQPLQDLIASKINEGVSNLLKEKFPGAGLSNNVV